jgi:hypothetical protein
MYGMNSSGSRQGQMMGFCEHGNEISGCIKVEEWCDWLRDSAFERSDVMYCAGTQIYKHDVTGQKAIILINSKLIHVHLYQTNYSGFSGTAKLLCSYCTPRNHTKLALI